MGITTNWADSIVSFIKLYVVVYGCTYIIGKTEFFLYNRVQHHDKQIFGKIVQKITFCIYAILSLETFCSREIRWKQQMAVQFFVIL